MQTLSNIRRSTTLKTRSVELPECFAAATVASAARAVSKGQPKPVVRRAVAKAVRVAGAL